jgi:hypothetical protein
MNYAFIKSCETQNNNPINFKMAKCMKINISFPYCRGRWSNHQLSQKHKSIENNLFNHLINILTLIVRCELKLSLCLINIWAQTLHE